jgi:beta-xylosidase
LRLKAYRPLEADKLLKAGNTLTQRTFRKQDNEVVIKMDISNMKDGQKNGLCHFSSQHSAIGIVKEEGTCYLEYRKNDNITRGIPIRSQYVWLRTQWGLDGKSYYYYSLDGDNFLPFGEPYQLVWGNYRGDRVGIYCFNDKGEDGFVDVDYFHYRL